MDFDQLETFLEVARHLSFSRAAEKRFRTQPAISAQIRALEEEIGAKILDRRAGRSRSPPQEKLFLKYVEETLEARRPIIAAMAEMERVPRGELVVAPTKAPACISFRRSSPNSRSSTLMSPSTLSDRKAPRFWKRLSRTRPTSGWSPCRSTISG